MSTYTTYLANAEDALMTMVNTFVNKQQIDSKDLCEYRTKARIMSMFVDMIPLLYNCDCVTEDEFFQMQNLMIKISSDSTLGIIDEDDLSCGGITSTVIHTIPSGGSTTLDPCLIQRGRLTLTAGS